MGWRGNFNIYGLIPLLHLIIAICYVAIPKCESSSTNLGAIMDAYAGIQALLVVLCWYNRKYIFGTKEIRTNSYTWTETTRHQISG
jgi:hypothetical protein